jgi:hypothetical protein
MARISPKQVRAIAGLWSGHLAHYRSHQSDEHREALIEETLRFVGIHLESDLSYSAYWAGVSLMRRVTVLLYLVDRGIVARRLDRERITFEAAPHAEAWVARQPILAAHLIPTFELLAALRQHQVRRLLRTPSH